MLKRALDTRWHAPAARMLQRLDLRDRAPYRIPTPLNDSSHFGRRRWDLRTIIALFPASSPMRFVNINTLLGMTGVAFDRRDRLGSIAPGDAFDLQLCLQLRDGTARTHKGYHSIGRALRRGPGGADLELGSHLRFRGAWPDYEILCTLPDGGELSMHFEGAPGMHWWANLPAAAYAHYTTFGALTVRWKDAATTHEARVQALHDHGWGRCLHPLPMPLHRFRYEVLRLGDEGTALALHTEGPAGFPLRCEGVLRRDTASSNQVLDAYQSKVLEWASFPNYAGMECAVPEVWDGVMRGPAGKFAYRARRTSEPQPLLGDGFLYAFAFEGEAHGTQWPTGPVRGEGYAEQMGAAWAQSSPHP